MKYLTIILFFLYYLGRTQGDGMEYESSTSSSKEQQKYLNSSSSTKSSLNDIDNKLPQMHSTSTKTLHYKPNELTSIFSPPPVKPKGKIFNLIPHLVYNNRTQGLKSKEPRFVPFEPYKAAVNPIIPFKRQNFKVKINKNNLDLNVLVSQMSVMKTTEMEGSKIETIGHVSDFDTEIEKLKRQVAEYKEGKEYYQKELKFQVQVNSELKNLLVAAVGEDIQTKVNLLTEDKVQLAKALLDTAQNLSSHTEQIEYLAGQSEVWRSKFLASSLMVEELARWKASLTQKNNLLLEANKNLLENCSKLRDMEIEILKNLKFISKVKTLNLPSSNILDLAAENLNISQQFVLYSGIGMPENLNLNGLDSTTDAEKLAVQALQNSNQPLMSTDEAFKAIVGQAFSSYPITYSAKEESESVK